MILPRIWTRLSPIQVNAQRTGQTINIHEAKTHFSRFVEAAAAGQEIIIAKAGKPTARLLPLAEPSMTRRFGALKGQIVLADDFDAPLPEDVFSAFEGK